MVNNHVIKRFDDFSAIINVNSYVVSGLIIKVLTSSLVNFADGSFK